jgi:hypothetical protein
MNDFDLTALIDRHDIKSIHRIKAMDRFTVTLGKGSFGVGKSVSEALANAERPDAPNIMGPVNDDRSEL